MYKTYRLGSKDGQSYIECLTCRMRSFNPNDIQHKYCGRCHKFHDEPQEEGHTLAAEIIRRDIERFKG